MEACPALFMTETEKELWKHIEVHGATAHQEDPGTWSPEERRQMRGLIRTT
jgi:hypothetical protein